MPAVFGRCKPVIYIDPLGGEDVDLPAGRVFFGRHLLSREFVPWFSDFCRS